MTGSNGPSGPQFRADRRQEQDSVAVTIVGGRPPGCGQPIGDIPRGIEVLLKKAAVDPEFRQLLLTQRAAAADTIGLELSAVEAMMLAAAPAAQLQAVIARTSVPQEHRRTFLGKAAVAMLAALGAMTGNMAPAAVRKMPSAGGARPGPDRPVVPPPNPPPNPPQPAQEPAPTAAELIEARVVKLLAARFKGYPNPIARGTSLVNDLGAGTSDLAKINKALEKEFKLQISYRDFKKLRNVGEIVDYLDKVTTKPPPVKSQPAPKPVEYPPAAGGVRPDWPPAGGLGGARP